MKKVTHLGPAGTYTEMAARAFGGDAELIPLPSVAEVIDTVIRNDACLLYTSPSPRDRG